MTTWIQRIAAWTGLKKTRSNPAHVHAEQDIARVFDEAKAAHARGDVSALRLVAEAIGACRGLANQDRQDPHHRTALASMLYAAGAMFNAAGNPGGALSMLDESRTLYEELGHEGLQYADMLVADVDARRARSFTMLQQGASAVVAVDAAVRVYRMHAAVASAEHAVHRDLARVLSVAAKVLFEFGDTDLAVAAADQAIRIYVFQASIINQLSDKAQHVASMTEAALIAEHVHASEGRTELVTAVTSMLTSLIPAEGALETMRESVARTHERKVQSVPSRVRTLAQSLQRLDKHELAEALTAPATDCLIFVPSDRASGNVALLAQQLLACIEPDLDAADVLRIGLEAHYLLASASERGLLRHDLQAVGPSWLGVLIRCADLLGSGGDSSWSRDLARWAQGIVHQLQPTCDPDVAAPLQDLLARLEADDTSRSS